MSKSNKMQKDKGGRSLTSIQNSLGKVCKYMKYSNNVDLKDLKQLYHEEYHSNQKQDSCDIFDHITDLLVYILSALNQLDVK